MQYTTRKQNLWFDIFAFFISFLMFAGIAWQAWINGLSIRQNQLETANLGISVWPFAFVLVVGATIVSLVFLRDFLKSVEEVCK